MAVPTQAPASQLSPCVQAFPSLQAAPLAFAGFEHIPVCGSHVPAVWHWSAAVHSMAVPTQAPASHASPCVQAFPSLQVLPLAFAGFEHVPVCGSHVPAIWHWSAAVHSVAVPMQAPASQLSPWVQAFPSLQLVPLAFAGFEQVPVCGSQVPALWHWSAAAHSMAVPTQAPASQLSPWVQAFPSLQLVPLVFAGFEQVPVCGSQVPALWHWSDAMHSRALPTQAPA